MSRPKKSTRAEAQALANGISRADFLKYCFAASSSMLFMDPVRMMLGSLVDGLIGKAQAQSMGLAPKNYVSLIVAGGPPRWVYDLPLNSDPGNVGMIATHKMSGAMQYGTVRMGSVDMPKLWSTSLDGGSGDMSALAANTLLVRGVRGLNSHEVARNLQTRPDVAAPSLNGFVADHSHLNLPAVRLLGVSTFKSQTGVGELPVDNLVTTVTGVTPLERALDPFIENRVGEFFDRRDSLDSLVNGAMRALRTHHQAGTPGSDFLYDNANAAENQIRLGLGDLKASYTLALAKYSNLVGNIYLASDWQSKLGFNMDDVSFKITNLAEVFAITEHLLKQKLSSTIHATLGSTADVAAGATMGGVTASTALKSVNNDAHVVNADMHLRSFSFYFRAIAACIHELSRELGSDWDNTVVHLGSEFTRNPRNVAAGFSEGSDHGWEGTNISLYSGAIKNGPYLVGNIEKDTSTNYLGVWGRGSPVAIDGSNAKYLGFGNMTSAVAQIVGVPAPQSNFASPVVLGSNGTVTSLIGPPKVIV